MRFMKSVSELFVSDFFNRPIDVELADYLYYLYEREGKSSVWNRHYSNWVAC